ncbi:hypothetical protein BU23DRAFT_575896 [Bimuria novae-zelandiae CBS 107.79]|uniref:RRM domain-containing protein n=1 Tax=Bimuria novae-zelandiae CBS 107.79 TaxID=1447943 RepID=A0A6A5UH19_9PLEO|nr:hypothetical protein BU23DRAFT_575896 [Bimuria novae-zelandiae CBS 107.79]
MASMSKLVARGFEETLQDCIEGIQNIPVDRRKAPAFVVVPYQGNHDRGNLPTAPAALANPSPLTTTFLLTTPSSNHKRTQSAPTLLATSLTNDMNRANLYGAPPRAAPPSPVADIRLKKPAVRVARPAGPAGSASGTPGRSNDAVRSSGSPGHTNGFARPVMATSKAEDGPAPLKATANAMSATPADADSEDSESDHDDLTADFMARVAASAALTKKLGPTLAAAPARGGLSVAQANASADSTNATLSFPPGVKVEEPTQKDKLPVIQEEPVQAAPAPSSSAEPVVEKSQARIAEGTADVAAAAAVDMDVESELTKTGASSVNLSNEDLIHQFLVIEREYMRKATEFITRECEDLEREYVRKGAELLTSLPENVGATGGLIKKVTSKLLRPYAAEAVLEPDAVEGLKSRYVAAIASFLENTRDVSKGTTPITKDHVKELLIEVSGNFIHLSAVFAEQGLMSAGNLDQLIGLAKAIESVHQGSDSAPTTLPVTSPKDSLDSAKSWPAREQRKNGPTYRTCILVGLPPQLSLNEVQALIWGGRVESIQLTKPGPGKALVKFLTAEGCEKYFKATENGINIPGSKSVVLVEKAPAPNSVNDVVQNCTDGEATRCVRVWDADDDWNATALTSLAKGKSQPKREVDQIKRGSNLAGRKYIEFRFASIYNALNFKRQLMDDEEFEHCTIIYAPDPCETSKGIHIKDDDETRGFF